MLQGGIFFMRGRGAKSPKMALKGHEVGGGQRTWATFSHV